MNKKLKTILMLILPAVILMINAAITVPAYADDGTPPPSDADGSIPVVTASSETLPAATPPAESMLPAADPLPSESGGVSSQSAEIIDPIWCPLGVVPKKLTGGCSDSFTNLLNLVNGFVPTGNGAIWIQSGSDSSAGPITMNGAGNWTSASNFSLALKGGWNGTEGTTTINGTSTFSNSISIIKWKGIVTLSDISVVGASSNPNLSAAILVMTTKDIKLERVSAINNTGLTGAILENTSGTGNVNVKGSTFSGNAAGVLINSKGSITLADITASSNTAGRGALLNNSLAPTPKNVTISGFNVFNGNFKDGLSINTLGAVTIANLTANRNGSDGVLISNSSSPSFAPVKLTGLLQFNINGNRGLSVSTNGSFTAANITAHDNGAAGTSITAGVNPVSILGVNTFYNNLSVGLSISSGGNVVVNSVTASYNLGSGVGIDNCQINTIPSTVCSINSKSVTISGTNTFEGNGLDGLFIVSGGLVVINKVTAASNGDDGLDVRNAQSTGVFDLKILGYADVNGNTDYGLIAQSKGGITVANLSGNYNGNGALIRNDFNNDLLKNVALTGATSLVGNVGYGLEILSHGNITGGNLVVTNNGTGTGVNGGSIGGASLSTSSAVNLPVIVLTGTNIFNQNGLTGSGDGTGLLASATGKITISNLSGNGNGGSGAQLLSSKGGVSLTGFNLFNNNNFNGLDILSAGPVLASNLGADHNDIGVIIQNSTNPALPQNVTLSGVSHFNFNFLSGFLVSSYGTIVVSNVTARHNGQGGVAGTGFGAVLDNCLFDIGLSACAATQPKSVILTGSNHFTDNFSTGLKIFSLGAVTINDVNGSYNGGAGVSIENDYVVSNLQNVTITGTNQFNSNSAQGLLILSHGTITLNNITSSFNAAVGVSLNNTGGSAARNIVLNGVNTFINNTGNGLQFNASGSFTITRIISDRNNGAGITGTAGGNITLTCGGMTGDAGRGYSLTSGGLVTIKGVFTSNNGQGNLIVGTLSFSQTCPLP